MRLLDLDWLQIRLVASASLVEKAIIRDELQAGRRSRAQAERSTEYLNRLLGGQFAVMVAETKYLPEDLERPVILAEEEVATLRAVLGDTKSWAPAVESGAAHPENLPEDLRNLSAAAGRADELLGKLDRAAMIPDGSEWWPTSRPSGIAADSEDVTRAVDRVHVLMSTGISPPVVGRWDVAYPEVKWVIEAFEVIERGTGDRTSPRDFMWRLYIDQLKSRESSLSLGLWKVQHHQGPVESFYASVLLREIKSVLAAAEMTPDVSLDSPSPLFWRVLTYVSVVARNPFSERDLKWEYDLYHMALERRALRPSIEKAGEPISPFPFASSEGQPRTVEGLAAPGLFPTLVESSGGQRQTTEALAAPGLFPMVEPLGAIAYAGVPALLAILLGVPVLGAIFAALTAISPPRWDYRPPFALIVFNAIVVAAVSWAATGRADTITLLYLAILAGLSIPLRMVVSSRG